MTRGRWLVTLSILITGFTAAAQKIVYSESDKDDTRRMKFEIAGKVGGNFLIYKNIRNKDWITVLDNDMVQIGKVEQDYVPDNDRVINIDFFPYSDFCYMIYQYQKKNVVYCMAARIDGNGKKTGDILQLDTTHLGFSANNKIYSVETSEDKSKIILFKINSKNKRIYYMTTLLLNDKLELLKKSRFSISMEERNDYLSDFYIDNDGDMVFSKFSRNGNDNISQAAFAVKYAQSDSVKMTSLNIDKNYLDEIHIKVDNFNRRYFLTSFYYKQQRGNIDGFYFYVWDKAAAAPLFEDTTVFSDELRREAKSDANVRTAFNDFFIRNIIVRRDGGFIIGSEAYYTTSRFNNWNRWDYLYGSSPYMSSFDNYYYSPYYSNYWRGSRWGGGQSAVRYHADKIAVLSFNKEGKLEWSDVLGKEQFDDESDDLLSYQVMNTGGQLHFLFNQMERRYNLLNDYSLTAEGQLTRNPTLKNLDKGYEFMTQYGKQVSARQMIVPCQYHNYICFAKIDYN
jgi:hypothetical protein